MQKNGLVDIFETQINRSFYKTDNIPEEINKGIQLSKEQTKIFEGLTQLADTKKACGALLFGVTGSGKTLIYMKLIEHIIKSGRTAILLVPEISISPQIFLLFLKYFGSSVALLHSKMSIGERRDEYNRIKNGQVKIVIGTRMAVFANLENIGAIIIDEEQEHTYKSEQSPRYDAVQIAKYRCAKDNALLLLGSATPSMESYYMAKNGKYRLYTLENRYGGTLLPTVEIVDMSDELKAGNISLISSYMTEQLKKNILNNEQAILFLNRRGHSTFISCVECGHVVKCKNCSIPMRLHKQ
jgi:primosomal protein N' (replication factor Y)